MLPEYIPGQPNCLGATILRAYYALRHWEAQPNTQFYRTAYDDAMQDVITHPHWFFADTVQQYTDMFLSNASTDNWCLLSGAMAAYQYETKNMRNK